MGRLLETERYLLLIEQLVEEEGSREAAAKRVGASESYPIKLRKEPWRNVGMDKLKAAKERMRLRSAFFDDASLGDAPDYRDFVIGSHVDRDDTFPELERYREDMERAGTPVAPEHFEKLRAWRRAIGPAEAHFVVTRACERERVNGRARRRRVDHLGRRLLPFLPRGFHRTIEPREVPGPQAFDRKADSCLDSRADRCQLLTPGGAVMGKRLLMVHAESAELPCGVRVTVIEAVVLEVDAPLPRPSRVPDVAADLAAAIEARDAHERRGWRRPSVRKAASTLRLVPQSEAA